jgi:hypothetical protein
MLGVVDLVSAVAKKDVQTDVKVAAQKHVLRAFQELNYGYFWSLIQVSVL